MKNLGKGLIIITISCLFCIISCEFIFSFVKHDYWFDNLTSGKHHGNTHRVKQPVNPDIAFYGDSFTAGNGVAYNKTFPMVVGSITGKLTANFGIGGSLTTDWLELLKKTKTKDNIVTFFLRDGTNLRVQRDFISKIYKDSQSNSKTFLTWFSTYNFIKSRLLVLKINNNYANILNNEYISGKEWKLAQKNILEMKKLSTNFKFVIFPVLVALEEPYPFQSIIDILVEFCEINGIECLNLLPYFMEKEENTLWVSNYDQHPSVLAHSIAAKAIVKEFYNKKGGIANEK